MKKVLKQIAGWIFLLLAIPSIAFTVVTLQDGMFYWRVFVYAVVFSTLTWLCWRPFPKYRIKPGVVKFFKGLAH